jgi:hypothetical protein
MASSSPFYQTNPALSPVCQKNMIEEGIIFSFSKEGVFLPFLSNEPGTVSGFSRQI